jgi:beta-glucanase (GH16 family)
LFASLTITSPHAPVHRNQTVVRPAAKPGYRLTFDEEFNEPRLNRSIWNVSNGPSYINLEQQYYTPDCVQMGNGYLRIKTEQRNYGGRIYTSGEVTTQGHFSQRYGWFEVRARMPTTPGLWTAIYLLPESGNWPPEIDVVEYLARDSQGIYLTNHWRDFWGNHCQCNSDTHFSSVDFSKWHVYAIDWEPGFVNWYLDGGLIGSTKSPLWCDETPVQVSSVPMYIRINDAIGWFGGDAADGPWPQYFDIDYVRVYKRLPVNRH